MIEIRGIRIDKTARRVWVNDEEKQFTTKEFDLLTFLAQNPNHVFTKEELSLVREDRDGPSAGGPVVMPMARPGSQDGKG